MVDKEIVQIKTRELYHLLLVKDADVTLAYRILRKIYKVAWYRQQVQLAKTPESESLARWSLDIARGGLENTLRKLNICDLDKDLVRFIANNYTIEENGK